MRNPNQTAIRTEFLQFLYALFVIILVPAALVFNTIYILKSVQRDIDFELNNKALLVESVIAYESRDKLQNDTKLRSDLTELISKQPEIKAIEIFRLQQNEIQPLVTTSPLTSSVADPALNQLAWGGNQAYSKQIFATIGSNTSERVWLVASPLADESGKKVGLINIYISAAQIDQISQRTVHDTIAILIATVIILILLLLNHFRFFQMSILFRRLNEVDRLKDDFINVASHELRAPLGVILNYSFVLNKIISNNTEAQSKLLVITNAALRLKSLVEDLLDVSRIEQNRMTFEFSDVDIRQVITEVVDEYKLQAQEKGLQITYERYSDYLMVYCDRNKLKQIILNLISNAIKYTPSGSIQVYHKVEQGMVKIFVKDTGVGISAENKEKLFNKFSRIFNERTKEAEGSGLGLWITKQLVEKMKGKIYVESMSGQGTQFIVVLSLIAKK